MPGTVNGFPMPEPKRRRFSARQMAPSQASLARSEADGSEAETVRLVVTVRRWGSAASAFKDAPANLQLWQLQVCHACRDGFTFSALASCREALLRHPNPQVRSTRQLEDVLMIKLIVGAPASSGPSDPDKVGIEDWRLVFYVAGEAPSEALEFIRFVAQHKIAKGQLRSLPPLVVACREELPGPLPEPWVHDPTAVCQGPFGALPPQGRRHVLCQLELQSDPPGSDDVIELDGNREDSHIFSLFGGTWGYKAAFDALGIPGGRVETSAGDEYIRKVVIGDDEAGKAKLRLILEDILMGVPVYLIDATGQPSDPLSTWLQRQKSVVLGERVP